MTENKRFKLSNFDSVCEILELLNTQRLVVSDMEKENEQLKQENKLLKIALCEELQVNGSSYHIDLFDLIFNLNYDEWERKNEYIEWEDLLNGDSKNDSI